MYITDDDTFDFDLDELFKEPEPENNDNEEPIDEAKIKQEDDKIVTQAVSKRINEVRTKTEHETQERIAKDLGFSSYADMLKANESKLIKDHGLDEQDTEELINKLVEKRLANDPRLQRLAAYEDADKAKFVDTQLKAINKLTGENFTKIEDLPEDTLKMWEKTGDLKAAYLATQGESLLVKSRAEKQNGSTAHLASGQTGNTGTKMRGLTPEEKEIYKSVLGEYTSDEELSKITVPNI